LAAWNGHGLDRWVNELEGADVLINLAGRSVDCRYIGVNKREILDSRILPTRVLGQAIRGLKTPPKLWMNASTATIYRHALDREMDEETGEYGRCEPDAPRAWGFSVDVAEQWEEEFFQAKAPGRGRWRCAARW
jgi:NAD dependent epimerase/dehydratase family enzyme